MQRSDEGGQRGFDTAGDVAVLALGGIPDGAFDGGSGFGRFWAFLPALGYVL